MKRSNCVLLAGKSAADRIRAEGLRQEQFSTLVGASGGPKWLVISQLDRVLIGEFFKGRSRPIVTLGSSIGSFRNLCYAMEDSLGALERLEYGYINQTYASAKPAPAEITAAAEKILKEVLGRGGAREVAENRLWHSHFVTVRGRGLLASERRALLAPALLASMLANALSRDSLSCFWDRVVFHSGSAAGVRFDKLRTINAALSEENVCDAVLASGSIPLVMAGVQNPRGAPAGNYRDGGITDYHFDLRFEHPEGLVFYPHFFPFLVPGWFDKSLPWRRVRGDAMENTLLVAPSPAFVARLPYGKIPDRNDFYQLGTDERLKYWNTVVDMGRRVADDFYELWQTGAVADHLIEVGRDESPHKLSQVAAI
ncbi:hypothetical protein OQJ46_02030 [Microbulbifer thermotolerans]|uniref:PNPLA domain-containing protein n=2 Tax=Microbulbifer thermotolerans TaxID=252514 RepID=A0AB35HWS0_MICTH|nr:patatin-like phospholipase family protein [Microbulbifer thermotolerans]MCX2780037.1 hypothetical protein [Microbulbifer thermotolerans]MCX2781766.1 hypothetical protein [Microbulbifer thermotolerans]MCX2795107.1 hypothetical protein [Microbulbifer thermotolerans]MCX2801864.1 hypothetical protein [Microbulbifer thermotolerans]MCX2805460.1 hypothetical protein [Microbulbifer thermotolerans]